MPSVNSRYSERDFFVWEQGFFRVMRFLLKTNYFSLEVHGKEHIPKDANLVFVSNHSGWIAIDALLIISYVLYRELGQGRFPYTVVHDFLFDCPGIGPFLKKCGAIPVSWVRKLKPELKQINTIGIFPEGEEGCFKPFWEAYNMRRWKPGFVKVAIYKAAKVVPLAVHGLEESIPSWGFSKILKSTCGLTFPIPVIPFPLPARCRVTFCEPIDLSGYDLEQVNDDNVRHKIVFEVERRVQDALNQYRVEYPLGKFFPQKNRDKTRL